MSETKWTAVCTWDEGWWVVEVPGAHNAATQAKRLDQVPQRVVEVLKLMEGIDVDAADIEIDARYPGRPGQIAKRARAKRAAAKVAQQAADEITAEALVELLATGLPQRDVGALLGMTHQRVAQLASRLEP